MPSMTDIKSVLIVAIGVILAGAIFHAMEDVDSIRYASDGFDL